MERFRTSFIDGAGHKGVKPREAGDIFDKLCAFSEFGFPKSHAYAFAVLAYQSAWLRHYYGAEYYAALLNNQPMGFYAPHVLIGDARRHGLQVLRVAINASVARCKPMNPEQILLGFETVRGIGEDLAKAIVVERETHGPYRSLPDLLRRTSMPRNAAEHLITVGALAEFGLGRRELLWQLGLLVPSATVILSGAKDPQLQRRSRGDGSFVVPPQDDIRSQKRRVRNRQLSLALPTEQDMVRLPDMTDWERMVADYGLLGLSPSYHPMALLRGDLPADVLTAEQVRASRDGARIRTAGLVVCRQRPGTAKGYVFLLLEDETGVVNIVIRPELYEAKRSTIRGESYLCIEGTVQLHSGTLNVIAARAIPVGEITTASSALPRAPERNMIPGYSNDKREAVSRELALAAPASHDFH
jgi:error-prone DNA polymerase